MQSNIIDQKDKDIAERRKILKEVMPLVTDQINRNIDLFISQEGQHGTLDYQNGEKYSLFSILTARSNDAKYVISYRIYVGIVEENIDPDEF